MNFHQFASKLLNEHNVARAKYGNVPPLTLDDALNNEAQNYANYLASYDAGLVHSHKPNLGENLFYYFSSDGQACTAKQVAQSFLDEVKYYDFKNGQFSAKSGHFTQMVWKRTNRLGIGAAQSHSGAWYVVCNYSPAGNVIGQFNENVFKPGSKSNSTSKPNENKNQQNFDYPSDQYYYYPQPEPFYEKSKCFMFSMLSKLFGRR